MSRPTSEVRFAPSAAGIRNVASGLSRSIPASPREWWIAVEDFPKAAIGAGVFDPTSAAVQTAFCSGASDRFECELPVG